MAPSLVLHQILNLPTLILVLDLYSLQGGSAESRTADPADETVLYTFSGQGSQSYQRAPVIGTGVITLSNDPVDVKTTSAEEGSGQITLSGESANQWVPNYPGGGLFRIGKKALLVTRSIYYLRFSRRI